MRQTRSRRQLPKTLPDAPVVEIKEGECLDLGTIELDHGGPRLEHMLYISLLPSDTSAVMVKYDPEIQVSCVIPPKEIAISYGQRDYRNNAHSKKKHTITTPPLIMSCGYGEVPTARTHKNVRSGYSLWAFDTKRQDDIYGKPYLLANVWERGSICFGTLNPSSLKQAFSYYWGSSFNNDLYRSNHFCDKKVHNYYGHIGCYCDGKNKDHKCQCPRTTFHRHLGCGCTTVVKSKKCKGRCESKDCACCQAVKELKDKAKELNPNIKIRSLNKLIEINNEPYPGCGCEWRHVRGCLCKKGLCDCPCICDCCKGTCEHPVCNCPCCTNKCRCGCNCSAFQRFEHHLKTYHDVQLVNQKWKKLTALFCGASYWAAPKGADGVIISNDKFLLKKIPRNFWKKDVNGYPLIVSLANKEGKFWVCESGNFKFKVGEQFVVTK